MTKLATNIRIAIALAAAVLAVAAVVPVASAQAVDLQVQIDQFTFAPQRITVKAGTTVTWINDDDIPHTVASSNKLFKSNDARYQRQILVHVHDARHLRLFLLPASAHDGNRRGRGGDRKQRGAHDARSTATTDQATRDAWKAGTT